MRFLGLGLEDRVADAKTVWLYREQLTQAGVIETLFETFDGHLKDQGYLAMGGQIIDASIVAVPKQRNSRKENAGIRAGETPECWQDKPAKRRQKDVEARWTKKHGRSHYGYKNHVNVDRRHKLVRRYQVSDAGRVGGWRGGCRVRWLFRCFRSGPQSVSLGPVSRPPLIKPDVRISRIRLSDEIMPSRSERPRFAA